MNEKEKEEFLEDFDQYHLDVESIFNEIYSEKEPDWMRKFFKKVLENKENADNYRNVATSVIKNLHDITWAKELYVKANEALKEKKTWWRLEVASYSLLSDINENINDRESGLFNATL